MSEAHIRDLIAANISIIEENLELLEVEQYIPSTLGTKSFIDLLAKDQNGHWVIIEIKKTNVAAREAAHEVFKYMEAVKRYFAVRNDEIRAIVAAVEWTELLVPFSELIGQTEICVKGIKLDADWEVNSITATPVPILAMNNGRYLAPWHELNLYIDEESLHKGIISYEESCATKGITDYVLIIMKARQDFYEQSIEFFGTGYEYILYFVPQILTKLQCLAIIESNSTSEELEEIEVYIEDLSGDEELCTLHEYVYDTQPRPLRDYYEIGYAAKFNAKLLEDEGWAIERIIREGALERNNILTDESIIEEIGGCTGSSGRRFKRKIQMGNKAHVASARDGLKKALVCNYSWLAHTQKILDEIEVDCPDAEVSIDVFSPTTGVFTLYYLAGKDAFLYMPSYEIAVSSNDGMLERIYIGILSPEGIVGTLGSVLDKFYEGDVLRLLITATFQFYEEKDAEIMEEFGLVYKSFRIDDPNRQDLWFELKNERWRSVEANSPVLKLRRYFEDNIELLQSIVKGIGQHLFEIKYE